MTNIVFVALQISSLSLYRADEIVIQFSKEWYLSQQ